jgi:hypothetical protein
MRIKLTIGLLCLVLAALMVSRRHELVAWSQSWTAAPAAPTATESGLRKCAVDGHLTYTNSPCPRGSAERALSSGTVSVVASPRSALPLIQSASAPPHARDLLLGPQTPDIRARHLEAVIGQ